MSRKIETWDECLHAMSSIHTIMCEDDDECLREEGYDALVDSIIEYEREILTNEEKETK